MPNFRPLTPSNTLITVTTPQCSLAAYSMLLHQSDMTMITDSLGVTGMEKVSDAPEPFCFRSIHPDEFRELFLGWGIALLGFERKRILLHGDSFLDHGPTDCLPALMKHGPGVLYGWAEERGHCVYWNGSSILDPRGLTYSYKGAESMKFEPVQFVLALGLA